MGLQAIDDNLLNRAIEQLDAGQPTSITPAQAAALRAEYARRRQPDNVAQDLDAAATPIEPDEEVGPSAWKKFNDAEMLAPMSEGDGVLASDRDAYLAKHAQALRNETQRMLDETAARSRAGYKDDVRQRLEAEWHANNPEPMSTSYVRNDEGSAYAPMTNFTPGATVMVDGVRVPAVDLGDGQLRYRLGDVKRAQEVADEARRVANVRDLVAREKERFDWTSATPTTDQLANRQEQKDAERAVQNTQRAQALRAERLAARAMRPSEGERMARVAKRADIAGGSQNINSGNRSFFRALAELEGVRPDQMDAQQQALTQMMPMDPIRAQVEARQLDQSARLAGDAITGALAGQGDGDLRRGALEAKRLDDAQEYFDQWHSKNASGGLMGKPYTLDARNQMVRYLRLRFKLDQPTAEAIADSKPSVVAGGAAAAAQDGGQTPGQRSRNLKWLGGVISDPVGTVLGEVWDRFN